MEGARMAKRYYLYSRKRKNIPAVWYARFRSDDGTMGSPLCTQQTDKSKAEEWAVEALLKGETLADVGIVGPRQRVVGPEEARYSWARHTSGA
jgi:hypothetical protein